MSIEVDLSFNRRDFSDDEIARAANLFDDIATTRTDTFNVPAAGSGFEIGVVISFLTGALASGIAYDLLKDLGSRLVSLLAIDGKPKPQLSNVRFTFQDKTVVLGYDTTGSVSPSPDAFFISEAVLRDLDGVFRVIVEHVKGVPLATEPFSWMWVPVRADNEPTTVALISRYWQTSKTHYLPYGGGRFYDSRDRQMLDIARR